MVAALRGGLCLLYLILKASNIVSFKLHGKSYSRVRPSDYILLDFLRLSCTLFPRYKKHMITYSQGMHNSLCFATYYKLVKYILVGKRCISCARLKLVMIKASTRTFIVTICNSCFGCYFLKLFSDWYEVVHQIVLMNYLPSETFVSKPNFTKGVSI